MAGIESGLGKAACSQACCRTVGTNNAAQAPLEPVRGCGSSGSSRRCRIAYDTSVASDTPPCAAPARACTILSTLFACGISFGHKELAIGKSLFIVPSLIEKPWWKMN